MGFKCFMRKEMHLTCRLGIKDVNISFTRKLHGARLRFESGLSLRNECSQCHVCYFITSCFLMNHTHILKMCTTFFAYFCVNKQQHASYHVSLSVEDTVVTVVTCELNMKPILRPPSETSAAIRHLCATLLLLSSLLQCIVQRLHIVIFS